MTRHYHYAPLGTSGRPPKQPLAITVQSPFCSILLMPIRQKIALQGPELSKKRMQTHSREPFSGDQTQMGHGKRVLVHADQILDSRAERSAAKAAHMHVPMAVAVHMYSPPVQAVKKKCKVNRVANDGKCVHLFPGKTWNPAGIPPSRSAAEHGCINRFAPQWREHALRLRFRDVEVLELVCKIVVRNSLAVRWHRFPLHKKAGSTNFKSAVEFC